jgi:uncharacterized protein YqeY
VSTSIRDHLQSSLKAAMQARDQVATSVLRTTLSAVANAEAVDVPAGTTATEVPRRHLTEDDIRAVVHAEHTDLERTAAELRRLGRDAEAEVLGAKAAVLAAHLVKRGDEGGEAACLLHELCPMCGAVPEGDRSTCWRCGMELG